MDSDKLNAWTNFISKLIWLILVVIGAAVAGKWLLTREPDSKPQPPEPIAKPIPQPQINWAQVDRELVNVLTHAHALAETSATQRLQAWSDHMMRRVDEDFLEWYFDYWTQQRLGLKSLWYWTLHQALENQPDATEAITEEIQNEFAKRVLRPEIAQLEMERIAEDMLHVYVNELDAQLAVIPEKYEIPQPDWGRYLEDIAVLTAKAEGEGATPLSLKAVTVASMGGGVALVGALNPAMKKIGGKVSAKLAAKGASKVAGKTGAKVAGKFGGKFLGAIVGVGVIMWEVWDHYETKQVELPILREALAEYFFEVRHDLLHEPESGMMAIINEIESNMLASLRTQPAQVEAQ